MMAGSASEAQKAPLKRSLFNKPAWSRPPKVASPAEFFHRSSSAYADVAAEAERKRKAKLARKQAERAKGDSEAKANGVNKRERTLSDSDDDSDGTSDRSHSHSNSKDAKDEKRCHGTVNPKEMIAVSITTTSRRSPTPQRNSVLQTLSKRYEDGINAKEAEVHAKQISSNIIELEDSGDEGASPDGNDGQATIEAKKPPAPEEDDFPASDDEYAELARKARERARRKRLEDDIVSTIHKPAPLVESDSHSQRALSVHQPTPPPPQSDPEVHILITSPLENTGPLIIKRKLSQRLKDVRVTWCQHQHFTADMTSTVFLTWRGKRLFDVTSCKSLGTAVDEDGNVSSKGETRLFGEEEQKVHMEAMTMELLEERKKAKNRKTEVAQGNIEDSEEIETPQKPQEPQVRIILKAKGFDDFKLIVKAVSYASSSVHPAGDITDDLSRQPMYPKLLQHFAEPIRRQQSRKTYISCLMESVWSPRQRSARQSSAIWTTLMFMSSKAPPLASRCCHRCCTS